MKIEKQIEQLFDNLRKVLFYVGHGKYNDHMSLEEVEKIKIKLEKILLIEKEYEKSTTSLEKELIYKRLEKFESFSIKDFIDYELKDI